MTNARAVAAAIIATVFAAVCLGRPAPPVAENRPTPGYGYIFRAADR